MRRLFLLLATLLIASAAFAQSPVLLPMAQQFFNSTGQVCSGCFVYTYVSGTFNPAFTYTDYTGSQINTNPIALNAAGLPQTSIGTQAWIWLQPIVTYRIVLKNAAQITLWQIDGVSGAAPFIFMQGLGIEQDGCDQITIGLTVDTALCFPAPASNIRLTFPNAQSDTMVSRMSVDTLANKTLITPVESQPTVNSVQIINTPGAYFTASNSNSGSGTGINLLTSLTSSGTVTRTAAAATGGVVGITVLGAGTTGNATVQQSGSAYCNTDNIATDGDYLQISTTTAGDCTDAGATLPASGGQVVGRVIIANVSVGGASLIILFPPEIQSIPGPAISSAVAGTGAGTSPTVTCGFICSDIGGQVVVITGSSPVAGAAIVTIKFTGNYVGWGCTFSPGNQTTAAISGTSSPYLVEAFNNGAGNNFLAINANSVALTAATTYTWYYTCSLHK